MSLSERELDEKLYGLIIAFDNRQIGDPPISTSEIDRCVHRIMMGRRADQERVILSPDDLIDSLRVMIKMVMLDLEATRRENHKLCQLLKEAGGDST